MMKLEANVMPSPGFTDYLRFGHYFLSSIMSLPHPRPLGVDEPTQDHGVYIAWHPCLKIRYLPPRCTVHFKLRRHTRLEKSPRLWFFNM